MKPLFIQLASFFKMCLFMLVKKLSLNNSFGTVHLSQASRLLLKPAFLAVFFLTVFAGSGYSQDAAMGLDTPTPWVNNNSTSFGVVNLYVQGETTSGGYDVCGLGKQPVVRLGSNNTHYIQIDIPDHDTKQYIINVTGSSNSGGSAEANLGIVYSSDVNFSDGSILPETNTSPTALAGYNSSCTVLQLTPPVNAKSVRIYKRIYYWPANNRISGSSSPSTGRQEIGDGQTARIASIEVWATATPTVQASNINVTNTTTTSLDLNWTRGNGTSVAVFVKEGIGNIAAIPSPVDATSYVPSANWTTKGTELVASSGYYNVYNGKGNTVSLTGLDPAKTYSVVAFEYSGKDNFSKYFGDVSPVNHADVITKALAAPTLTIVTKDVFSTKLTGEADITDNGGVAITEKGWIWSTTPGVDLSNQQGQIVVGTGDDDFSSEIRILQPSTTYYIKAYATNAIGTAYSNEMQITTAAPAPLLQTSTANLDFGSLTFNSASKVLSYTLANPSADFTPLDGNITVTAPTGFLVSLTQDAGFAQQVDIPYTGGKLAATTIYVQLPTSLYGVFSGDIIHSGGGVLSGDADKVSISGAVVQEELSNMGTEFYVGFGFIHSMPSNDAGMSLYIAAGDQSAEVTVNASSFSVTESIPANTVREIPIPKSLYLDATGVSDKAIHIVSNGVPVSVWMYSYHEPGNSAAGAMVFPVNTWSSSYDVQTLGGNANVDNPNSYFFVIANADNTEVKFTPTQDIVATYGTSAAVVYPAGLEHTITLNRGEVFNAMGKLVGSKEGLDLSGTKVSTTCDKQITVFAGNGRVFVLGSQDIHGSASGGADHLIQQMFPLIAWGTEYLTVPTKSMEYNIFRIHPADEADKDLVTINGVAPSSVAPYPAQWDAQGKFWLLEGNIPFAIKSTKPISVSQFIESEQRSGGSSGVAVGNNGAGDPEMVILSPVQQAINKTSVYMPDFKGGNNPEGGYINVVIKKTGVSTFKFMQDGKLLLKVDTGATSYEAFPGTSIWPYTYHGPSLQKDASGNYIIDPNTSEYLLDSIQIDQAFKEHPGNPDYAYAKFRVPLLSTITMSSDVPFNAIAYGMNKGESWGFNAGASVKNLSSLNLADNEEGEDSSPSRVRASKNYPTRIQIALTEQVTSIDWNITGQPIDGANVTPVEPGSTVAVERVIDGTKYYIYSSPKQYLFTQDGLCEITVTTTGLTTGTCGSSSLHRIPVLVGVDDIKIDYPIACGNLDAAKSPQRVVNFTNNTIPMTGTTIDKWVWDFGDGSTPITIDPTVSATPASHTYDVSNHPTGIYTLKITTTNSAGIVTKEDFIINLSGEVKPDFSIDAPDCTGSAVEFDPSASTVTGPSFGAITEYVWTFYDLAGGVAATQTETTPVKVSHTYTLEGTYRVTLTIKTDRGCEETIEKTVKVGQLDKAVLSSQSTETSITFNWSAITGAATYEVSTDGGVTFVTPSEGASATQHIMTGLGYGETVKIIVKAKGTGTCESTSDEYSAKTGFPQMEIFIPNTFTPNGDGKNDKLQVYGNYIQSLDLRVFNQWGEMIYHTTDVNEGWDGFYKGNQQPVGVYIYVVSAEMQDGSKINKKGAVNLIR